MNSRLEEARELLAAAARDRIGLIILGRDPQAPLEVTLFLAQQAIEKAIKAALATSGAVYRRTHDLVLLDELASQCGLSLPVSRDLLLRLAPYAVEFRYLSSASPAVTLTEAHAAVETLIEFAESLAASQPPSPA